VQFQFEPPCQNSGPASAEFEPRAQQPGDFAQTEMPAEILTEVIDKLEPDFRVVFVCGTLEEFPLKKPPKRGISFRAKSRLLRAR